MHCLIGFFIVAALWLKHATDFLPRSSSMMGLCVVCMEYRDCKRCMCGGGFYCSKECQMWHWAEAPEPHRLDCPIKAARDLFRSLVPRHVADHIFTYVR